MTDVNSNMTGTVLEVLVKVGDQVAVGQDVAVLESMKMEMNVQSTVAGKVAEIKVGVEDFVQEGQVLLCVDS